MHNKVTSRCYNNNFLIEFQSFVHLSIHRVHLLTSEPVPAGCTMTTVGATCEVHLMLRGMVDADKEVARLEEKIEKLNSQVDKLKKAMSIDGYEEKVYKGVL